MILSFLENMIGAVPVGYEVVEYVLAFIMIMEVVNTMLDMLRFPFSKRKR